MEKAKSFLRSLKFWQILVSSGVIALIVFAVVYISPMLRQTAKIKLGSDAGLVVTADRQDSLGTFTDTKFTLKTNKDLSAAEIRNSITFFPEVDFDIQEISPRQFNISPKAPLKDNSIYRLKVLSEAKTYSWAFQTKNDFRIVQTLPRDKGNFVPLNSGIEITFSHDNWDNPENFFSITPKVEGNFERHKRTLVFVPKSLAPDTLYTVTLKKGLSLKGSSDVLKNDYTFKFETKSAEDIPQVLGFSRSFYEFSTSETPAFDIYAGETKDQNIDVKVYQYPSEEKYIADYKARLSIPSWAINSARTSSFSTSSLSKVLEFSTPVQKQVYISYFMLPKNLDKGYYLVEAKSGKVTTQSLFQITDLSAYLSLSGTKTLVWVNDTSTGNPVEKAKVSFAGKDTDTGSDGVAYFDTPQTQLSDSLDIVTVRTGGNTLILPPQSVNYYGSRDYQNSRRISDKYWSYLYFDRPAYLPTDKVKIWGLLRDRDNLSKKQKFRLEITKSDYNSWDFNPVIVQEKDIETSDLGTFLNEIPLANYTPGNYGLTLKVNDVIALSSSFLVETYTKPAYTISLDSSKKAIFSDETVTFSGKTTFFEGTPVSNMPLRYSGPVEGTVSTNTQGNFSIPYTPGQGNSVMNYAPEIKYLNVMPARQEEGLIQAGASVAVYDSRLIFGTSKQEVKNNIGKVDLNLRLVDTAKYDQTSLPENIYAPATSRSITGQALQVEYVKREVGTYYDFINKTTSPRYEYDRVTNKIDDISIVTNNQGTASYTLTLQSGKSYELTFDATDDKGKIARQTVYLYGSTSAYPQDNYVYLKTGKTGDKSNTYAIGERVDLTMMRGDSPLSADSKSKFLYVWAQRGIKSYQVNANSTYSFNYPEAFNPNVVIQAIRFTGKAYEVAESLYLNFDTSSKKISLDVSQNKSTYAPGDTAKISVLTKNSLGSPVSAEVNLNLVDEAYFKLYPQNVDPLSGIYRSLDADIVASYYSHRYPLDAGGAERGGCFLAGTKILMSDGSSKSIENIKIGDQIKTRTSESSEKLVSAKVLETYKHLVSGYLLINNQLRVTSEHNLYINGRWMTAKEARVGDEYLDSNGKYHTITSIQNMSGLNTVYNLSVADKHTYFADGFYVHNEKGRELFVDNAFFGNIQTGSDGKGSVDVKLPDNLTSWRITSQAITKDLQAGASTNNLIVKQPFFVDAVLNTEYLTADRPSITVRAFGEDLSAGETVNISVQIPTLEIDKQITAKAFEPVQVNLGTLKSGDHRVTIAATSARHSDKLIRLFKVVDSRLTMAKAVNVNLSTDTIPVGSADSYTKLVFSDQSTGRFFPSLSSLGYSWGDRLDQKVGRTLSQELIKKYFDDSITIDSLDTAPFQTSDGGYSIYPYTDTDLDLSANMAALIPDRLDKYALANYLYKSFAEAKDVDTAAKSLFGLASLNEPVLILINNFSDTAELTPMSRIYLALAQAEIGDTENAYQKYQTLLTDFGKTQDNLTFMQVGKDKDSYLEATSLTAALASLTNAPEADSLFAYTVVNASKDILLTSPRLLAIRSRLENVTPSSVSFTYTLNGQKVSKTLEKGKTFTLLVSPSQLSSIKFSEIKGNVGLTSTFLASVDQNSSELNKSISVKRIYSVSDKPTNSFNSSDLVKISLSTSMGDISQDGCYQVSDLLPSGLKPITNVYSLGVSTDNVWYPYEVNGQKVSFCIGKSRANKPINYYARVISTGEYKSESALIQSLISPSVFNLSTPATVLIK